jgi:hypothetical protein
MSLLWAAAAACVLIGAFSCRVFIVARARLGVVPTWLAPALFAAMLLAAVVILAAGPR